jgi:hypothetical protein
MEGERRAGQEAFSDFLINLASGYSALPEAFAETLGLYIKLSYGDNNTARVIPFGLGTKVAILSSETARLTREAARLQADKRRAFEKQYKEENWAAFYSGMKNARGRREATKYVVVKTMTRALDRKEAGSDGGPARAGFLRAWPEETSGWGIAELMKDRGYYGWDISRIYIDEFHCSPIIWWALEPFVPLMNYPNDCAVDFSPGKPGKEALEVLRRSGNARSYMESTNFRKDVVERKKVLQEQWGYLSRERPAAARTWEALDTVGRWYLLVRSCDWVMYGKEFADKSFPDPSNSDYSGVVEALVWLFEEHEAELIKKLENAERAKEREHIEKYCADSVENIVVSPPEQLTPRVLDAGQIRAVRDACIE